MWRFDGYTLAQSLAITQGYSCTGGLRLPYSLKYLIPLEVPLINRLPGGRPELMHVRDGHSRDTWLSADPMTPAAADAFVVQEPFIKFTTRRGSMDLAWFERSPGAAADGAVQTQMFNGRKFILAAAQGPPQPLGYGGVVEMAFDTYYGCAFAAGRCVEILTSPAGEHFFGQIDMADGVPISPLPPGFSYQRVRLDEPWVAHARTPARLYFFAPCLRSLIGPIRGPLPTGAGVGLRVYA